MSSLAELRALVDLPDINGEIAFHEPWEAQVFALTLGLHDKGLFTWSEWAGYLNAELEDDATASPDAAHDHYFDHWAAALERIVEAKRLVSRTQMESREEDLVRNAPTAHQHKARREPVCID